MTTTTFVNGVTVTDADWFNDVDAAIYQGTFPSGITALAFTGATTFTAFAGATTLLTLGGTGATAVVALPGTLEASGTTGALTVAGGVYIAKKLNVVGNVTLTGDLAVNGGDLTSSATTFNLLATPTTVNAFAGASVALNIGNASAAAAFPGGITIPTGKTLSGAGSINITGTVTVEGLITAGNAISISAGGLAVIDAPITLASAAGVGSAGSNWLGGDGGGGVYLNAVTGKTINFGVNNDVGSLVVSGAGVTIPGTLGVTGAVTTNGGLQTFGANDSAGAGYRTVRVPNV